VLLVAITSRLVGTGGYITGKMCQRTTTMSAQQQCTDATAASANRHSARSGQDARAPRYLV